MLIERLQTGGGTIVVSDPDSDTRANYRRAIHAAKQHKLVPDGYELSALTEFPSCSGLPLT